MSYQNLISVLKGGPGSGNWGHSGRPGVRGGSAPKSGIGAAMSLRTGRDAAQRQAEASKKGKPSMELSTKAKDVIAKRIRGIADFSRERDVTIQLTESALNEQGRQYVSIIGSLKGSAKDFKTITPDKLNGMARNPKRLSDALAINWYGKGKSERRDISADALQD